MKKRIIIIVETEEDNKKIIEYTKRYLEDNFKEFEKAEVKIEDEK